MNLLTKFHEDWTVNVASRVLTRFYYSHIRKNTNLLTKFHEDRILNVASRFLTRFYYSHIRKNAPHLGSNVFQAKATIFKLIQDIIGKNLLTKFHENRKINVLTWKNAPPPWWPCFSTNHIIGMNLLTKFHEDWKINVASREKCPPLGNHVFPAKVTVFELIQDFIGTNLLSKFHEDRKINVAS
ncbi:hypothetical protein DPMN_036350 [Dreissena polymorpha]|uniref:Uncharacterized protein n=1 Tax=Dreissena polymorpha TaxID=45954 RepID=A0A9D4MBC0_DREPO|nr:hypothetical protein DPMN_036350 [Dreissena polymorpha]